ncbi:MAG: diacylglycerol kinase [Actinomycetota bacterium]|nr:diacylglycerol kinase [Actinomycetota bacterium]
MTYRVIQWSTGNVGTAALRCIIGHPELELVGVWVHSTDKAGKDAGDLCGLPPTGVRATNDADALLALDADCVSYTATADLRPMDAITDMARLLRSGKNIVSSSVVAAIFPPHLEPSMRKPLEDACAEGGVSFFTSGIDPGWANDALPLLLAGTCEEVELLRVMEIVNYKHYEQPTVLFETMGFGQALDSKPLLLLPGVLSFAWGGVIKVLAAGLGVEVEELREVHERRPAPERIDLGFGVIEQGTTAAMRFEVQGIVGDEPRIILEHVTRLDDALCPDWPQPVGAGGYRVVVTGTPSYECDVQMTARPGQGDPGVIGTAGRLVNAIPDVCAAAPGLLSVLDLPLVIPKGLMR